MRPDQAQQWVTTETMRAEQKKNPSSYKKLKEKTTTTCFSHCVRCASFMHDKEHCGPRNMH